MADRIGKPVSQRQLRVGEMIKQSLSMIFIRNEAKVPNLETNTITVTEVRMSPDLKIAIFKSGLILTSVTVIVFVSKFGTLASFLIKIMLKDCLIISPTLNCLCDTGFPILSAIKLTSQ